jgi:hypothetical protein
MAGSGEEVNLRAKLLNLLGKHHKGLPFEKWGLSASSLQALGTKNTRGLRRADEV